MARPVARLGALDSKAVFDSTSISRRKHAAGVSYYNKAQEASDTCILEHEILLSSTDVPYDGDKEMRVFSSLNGMGAAEGVSDKMSTDTKIMCMKQGVKYAGVSVTDFITMNGTYAPEEGRHLTITHGGLNTIHSPVEPLRAGDMLQVDLPTNAEAKKMRRRRGASHNKVTPIVRRYNPYSVATRTRQAMRAVLLDGRVMHQDSPAVYNKWNKMGSKMIDSYLYVAHAMHGRLASTGLEDLGLGKTAATQAGEAIRQHLGQILFNSAAGPGASARTASTHFDSAIGAMADAIEDDRRWVIGKCTTGCKEGGYATVALGVR